MQRWLLVMALVRWASIGANSAALHATFPVAPNALSTGGSARRTPMWTSTSDSVVSLSTQSSHAWMLRSFRRIVRLRVFGFVFAERELSW